MSIDKALIGAIKELILFYRTFPQKEIPPSYYTTTGKACPLCAYSIGKCESLDEFKCLRCPWLRFERKTCTMGPTFVLETAEERLNRLHRWLRIIEGKEVG